ncbi:MAG: AAA family ATPase, partial [Nocardioidaceae bacterium]|nr:AAA family ATPase [Nocardioidaceae bacterium]
MLLERDELLLGLRHLAVEAESSHGRLVFVAGEAGVGKTTLVNAVAAEVADRPMTVRRGGCDDLTTPAALGPVLEALPELDDALEEHVSVGRLSLFRRVRDLLAAGPTLLVLDDVHWADEATLDLLRYLGRRIDGLPLLVVATYRSEEVGSGHPLAATLGRLTSSPVVVRLQVPPLSAAAVRELAARAGSALDADELFRTTGGNAFYVTEVLASRRERLPATVRDAVLGRVARLSADARTVLGAAAVLGQP